VQTKKEVEIVVSTLAVQIRAALGDKLNSVILYGSYARNDFEDGSDVDVMVLVDVPQDQITEYRSVITDITFELGWVHNLLISPVIRNTKYRSI